MRKIKLSGSTMVKVVVMYGEDGVRLVPRYWEYQPLYPSVFDLIREIAARAEMTLEDVRVAANAETWKNARAL